MELSSYIKTRPEPALGSARPLSILFASSEVAPFSKTGGLGDVAAALPTALAAAGHHVYVVTPLYRPTLDPERMGLARRLNPLDVPRQGLRRAKLEAVVWEGRVEGRARIFFIDAPEFFDRPGIYGEDGDDFEDNAARFAFFSRAVVEFARSTSVKFDIVHCNDWHTALSPLYARHYYGDEFDGTAFVTTIHNLAFQGRFARDEFSATGLPASKYLKDGQLLDETNSDQINFLRAGIVHADHVTTVSPTYASEISATREAGFGLADTIAAKRDRLDGVLNGADYQIWSPEVDREIPVRYNVDSLNNKRRNKAELQHMFELPVRPTLPLLGFIGRLTEQKGLTILVPALRELLSAFDSERDGFQIVLLGEGEKRFRDQLDELAREFPRRVAVRFGYQESIAHQIQAGSDILLVPSQFEPCGLTQIYAMRYGTLPLVHATGGLADTVRDAQRDQGGTGFTFDEFSTEALAQAIDRATESYRHYRRWRPLMVRAMAQEFSWDRSARRYTEIYRAALDSRAAT